MKVYVELVWGKIQAFYWWGVWVSGVALREYMDHKGDVCSNC